MTVTSRNAGQEGSSSKRKRTRMAGSNANAGSALSPGVSLGVLSLSRGGNGPHGADHVQGYGVKGALPLVKQGLRQICSEAFGASHTLF